MLGTLSIAAGLLLGGWAFVVWQWGDPITSIYTSWEQRELRSELARVERTYALPPSPNASGQPAEVDVAARAAAVRRQARRLRTSSSPGHALGRIRVSRLGLNMVLIGGTDASSLKRGPGVDGRTHLPGEGQLVYIAGHRTTYSAPLAKIDTLRRGDRIVLEMPYGTFVYSVTRHSIVDDQDLSVLASHGREEVALQACHPRFFASQRYIVWASPAGPTTSTRRASVSSNPA